MSQSDLNPNSNGGPNPNAGVEKLLLWWDGMKRWFYQAARLGWMMARGAYLLGERRRLLAKLGEQVLDQMKKGGLSAEPLRLIIENLELVTQSIESEERRIQEVRNSGLENQEAPPIHPNVPPPV